jgi:hypothetical protein
MNFGAVLLAAAVATALVARQLASRTPAAPLAYDLHAYTTSQQQADESDAQPIDDDAPPTYTHHEESYAL